MTNGAAQPTSPKRNAASHSASIIQGSKRDILEGIDDIIENVLNEEVASALGDDSTILSLRWNTG